nr:Gag-Pol polyprotein [Tanacetum cinerariifolium]
MSTQQDIYAAGSESHPPMLNKENYVPWSSRLLRYAKSRPNGKLIHDELSDKELKQIEADDQAIQTILLGLPEDIYAAVNSCKTAQEIWLRVQQMMKGSNIGIQVKKAKLFNERERFTSNKGESIESYYHRFLKLMNDLKRNKHFPEKIASNLKFLNNLQPEWSRHVTIVHQTKDLHTADYTQLYNFLKYNQKEVDELKAERIAKTQDPLALMANSNNPYIAQPRMNMGQDRQAQMVGVDLDKIEEVNANCILMANLQQTSTSAKIKILMEKFKIPPHYPPVIVIDPDDQPMWSSTMTIAPTPSSAIIQLPISTNFRVKGTYMQMIRDSQFDGRIRSDPHRHIDDFLEISSLFQYGG